MNKSNKIVLIVLGVLIGVFLITKFIFSEKREGNIPKRIADIKSKDVKKVEVYYKAMFDESKYMIERDDSSKWFLYSIEEGSDPKKRYQPSYRDAEFLDKTLDDLEVRELVSVEPSKFVQYFPSNKNGKIRIFNYKDKVIADLVVGSMKFIDPVPGFVGYSVVTYVRRADEDNVYTVKGYLDIFGKTLNEAKENRCWKYNVDDVVSFSLDIPQDKYFVEKDSATNKWLLDGKTALKDSIVKKYLQNIHNLGAYGGKDGEWSNTEMPQYKISITLKDKKRFNVEILERDSTLTFKTNYHYNILQEKKPQYDYIGEVLASKKDFISGKLPQRKALK